MGWRSLISKVNLRWKILAVRTLHAENDRRKDKAGKKLATSCSNCTVGIRRNLRLSKVPLQAAEMVCQGLEIFDKFGLNWRVLTAGAVGLDPRMSSCLVLLLRKFSSPRWPKFMQYNSTDSRYVHTV